MPAVTVPSPVATVVGGGPAGLMAAELLARAGFAVTVHEHRPSVGRKFILAGRGGLNITHSEPFEALLRRYGPSEALLEPALRAFGPAELRSWCAELEEPTFVGSSGRVFPASFRATPLLRAWLGRLGAMGVQFRLRERWLGVAGGGAAPASRFLGPGGIEQIVCADVTLLALGGASWPRVGSDAGWVEPFERAGVEVVPLQPANCGIEVSWSPAMADRFAGAALKNVAVSVDGPPVRGDCVVTESGLEGGPVYAQSAALRGVLERAETATLHLDLQPDLTVAQLGVRLAKRRPKESTSTWLRKAGFGPLQVALLREATGNRLPATAEAMGALAKAVPIRVAALMPIDRAISSAGGVSVDEVDEAFMLHKLPGVFIAGEMLDWEAPTGGYLLQACFSTAAAAAAGAIAWHAARHPIPA